MQLGSDDPQSKTSPSLGVGAMRLPSIEPNGNQDCLDTLMMIVTIMVTVPVAIVMPTLFVTVPPSVVRVPAAFTLRVQVPSPFFGLVAALAVFANLLI